MNKLKIVIVIALSWTLASCGFVYKKELIDNYFLVACDVGEQMSLDYNNDEAHNQNYSTIILETVFDVKWNDRFIVVKTHPADIKESIRLISEYKHLRNDERFKIDSSRNSFTQQEVDAINDANVLAKKEADSIAKSISLLKGKEHSNGQVTLYYLLDTRNQNQIPSIYLTENELNVALRQRQVGVLNHSKYFKDLDKTNN
jgi:hypothetical protein